MNGPSTFRFSLERVRALRERTEDAARGELAGALSDERRSQDALDGAAETLQAARQAQRPTGTGPVNAEDLLARQFYLERSEQALRASREVLERSQRHVEQRREALTEAARERQALEKLKERRRSDHEREQARRESAALDEIALNGFRRREAA